MARRGPAGGGEYVECIMQSVACCILNEYFMVGISSRGSGSGSGSGLFLIVSVDCVRERLKLCNAIATRRLACVLHFNGRSLSQRAHLVFFMAHGNVCNEVHNKIFIDLAQFNCRAS